MVHSRYKTILTIRSLKSCLFLLVGLLRWMFSNHIGPLGEEKKILVIFAVVNACNPRWQKTAQFLILVPSHVGVII